MLISHLPFEIIEHINDYLTHEDRYQLIFIDHIFYSLFIRLLYRTIRIETHLQLKQLIYNFEQTESARFSFGHYVYDLSILLDQVSESELRKIQLLCPQVQSVHIDWRIWNYLSLLTHPFHTPSAPRNYHPRKTLPLYATEFISNYGAAKLSSLTLDLYHITNIDPTTLLACTPYLRSLKLMGINQRTNISFELIEFIHESCPYLETLSLEGYKAEVEDFSILMNSVTPLKKMKSFQLKSQYGADRFQQWLPYIALKYPQLTHLDFYHSGESKDLIVPCPVELYRQFIMSCPQLIHLSWNNTAPDFQFFQELDRSGKQRLVTLTVNDNLPVSSLLTCALFSSKNNILRDVTDLSFGPLPRDITPNDLVHSIAQACPQLKRLELREPHCNPASPFKIDVILNSCRSLTFLRLVRIALRVSFNFNGQPHHLYDNHPLEELDMQHCSSFDGVFEHISIRCPKLTRLNLFAFTQRDRRYKVQIHLPYQQLKKVQLHSLRTETFDMERRIRFFHIQHQDEQRWYYMHKFEIKDQETLGRGYNFSTMEITKQMVELNPSEVRLLVSFLNKPMPWSDVDSRIQQFVKVHSDSIAQFWNAKDIYDAGHVDFVCDSVEQVYLNKKLTFL